LDASTGAKIWNYTTGYFVTSSPAVSGGTVYVGSDDGNVYALDASTGAKIWSYAIDNSEVSSSPAVSGGVVYIGSDYVASDESNFYALNASTGAKIWGCNTNGSVNASPAVSGGVVYLCLGKVEGEDQSIVTEGGVYALNASTGAKLWNYADDSPEGTSPSISGGTVYVHFLTGKLYAFGKTYMFPIRVDSNTYNAQIVSGSIVSAFSFDQSAKKIGFNVTGTDGHCNITMPAALIGGPYTTMLDGVSVDPTPNSNATHVSMYFAYASSTHRIEVIGTTVIPEFSTMIVISLTMVILSVAIIYAKKKSDL
jgi:outer membrane protein assembly factor BamB